MNLRENKLKKLLKSGGVALGCGLGAARDPDVIFNIAATGADFVFIDLEHGPYNLETAIDMVLHTHASGMTPMIRVPDLQYAYLTRLLDNGANCLTLPHIKEPAEVARFIELARYHPAGKRGWALSQNPGANFQNVTDPVGAATFVNENVMLGLNIETKEAVENLNQMLMPGIDYVIVGFFDLSQSYGVLGQVNHKVVEDAKAATRKLCKERGIFLMDAAFSMDQFKPMIDNGVQIILYSSTNTFIRSGMEQALKTLKEIRVSAAV
jgi:2-dehydro-3-deoxyglucarate aldolase/4-hydroxy-2-oxoheptanedioate aldolase